MHQSTTSSLSQTIWARWATRQFLSLPIVETLLSVTFGYSLTSEAVVMRQLRRWKRLCVLSIKVPRRKKSGNLTYAPRYIYIYIYIMSFFWIFLFFTQNSFPLTFCFFLSCLLSFLLPIPLLFPVFFPSFSLFLFSFLSSSCVAVFLFFPPFHLISHMLHMINSKFSSVKPVRNWHFHYTHTHSCIYIYIW